MSGPLQQLVITTDLDLGERQLINTSWLYDGRTSYNKYDLALVLNDTMYELWMYNGDTRLENLNPTETARVAPTAATPGDWTLVSAGGGSDGFTITRGDPNGETFDTPPTGGDLAFNVLNGSWYEFEPASNPEFTHWVRLGGQTLFDVEDVNAITFSTDTGSQIVSTAASGQNTVITLDQAPGFAPLAQQNLFIVSADGGTYEGPYTVISATGNTITISEDYVGHLPTGNEANIWIANRSMHMAWDASTNKWIASPADANGVQVLATDPTGAALTEGLVWYNSTDDDVKYYDGTNVQVVATSSDLSSKMDLPEGWGFNQVGTTDVYTFGPFNSAGTLITSNNAYFVQGTGIALEEVSPNALNQAEGLRISVSGSSGQGYATEAELEQFETLIEDQLTRKPTDSESFYQFTGTPEAFTETSANDRATILAFDDNFSAFQELTRSGRLEGGTTPNGSTKVVLRYGSGASDFKEYLVAYANYGAFYIADENTVARYTLENLEDGYSFYSAASSGETNGGVTGLYESKLWLGNSRGAIVEIPHGSLFDSSGNLAGRTLPKVTPQGDSDYYAVHTITQGDNSPIYGLDYFYDGAGHAALIAGNRNRRVFRLRDSGTTISFDEGGILTAEMGDYTVPNSATFTAGKFAIRGIKSFTLDGAIEGVGEGYPTMDNGSRMYVIYGDTVEARSGNFPIPGFAIANNLHSMTDAEFSARGVARVPGGNDPSEQYVGYSGNSSTFDPELDMTIFDVDYYSDDGENIYLIIAGQQNGVSSPAEQAQMWYCDFDTQSPWQPQRIATGYKAGLGSPIYSISHGPDLSNRGINGVWLSTGNGAVWSVAHTPASLGDQNSYSDLALLQVYTNPSDSTSDPITTGIIRGFDVFGITQSTFDSVYAAGVNSDGHVVRWDLQPDITVTVRHNGINHVATFNYEGDATDARDHFAVKTNYTPNLGADITIATDVPTDEPAGQLYIDFSVAVGSPLPGVTVSHGGAFIATDPAFAQNQPWRVFSETATTVTVMVPDGNFTFTTVLSSAETDATTVRAVEQVRDTINHSATGLTAEILGEEFNPSITLQSPVLQINQPGVHSFANRPVISIANAGDGQASQTISGSLQVNSSGDLILTSLQEDGATPTTGNPLIIPPGTVLALADGTFSATITAVVTIVSGTQAFGSNSYSSTGTAPSTATPFVTVEIGGDGGLAVGDFADGAFDTIGAEGGLFNPNDYYTKPQINAKIDAIETIMDTGSIVEPTVDANDNLIGLTIDGIGYSIDTELEGVGFHIHEGWTGHFSAAGTIGNFTGSGTTAFEHNTGPVRTLTAFDSGANSLQAVIPNIGQNDEDTQVVVKLDLLTGVGVYAVTLQGGQSPLAPSASRVFSTTFLQWQPDSESSIAPLTAVNRPFAVCTDVRDVVDDTLTLDTDWDDRTAQVRAADTTTAVAVSAVQEAVSDVLFNVSTTPGAPNATVVNSILIPVLDNGAYQYDSSGNVVTQRFIFPGGEQQTIPGAPSGTHDGPDSLTQYSGSPTAFVAHFDVSDEDSEWFVSGTPTVTNSGATLGPAAMSIVYYNKDDVVVDDLSGLDVTTIEVIQPVSDQTSGTVTITLGGVAVGNAAVASQTSPNLAVTFNVEAVTKPSVAYTLPGPYEQFDTVPSGNAPTVSYNVINNSGGPGGTIPNLASVAAPVATQGSTTFTLTETGDSSALPKTYQFDETEINTALSATGAVDISVVFPSVSIQTTGSDTVDQPNLPASTQTITINRAPRGLTAAVTVPSPIPHSCFAAYGGVQQFVNYTVTNALGSKEDPSGTGGVVVLAQDASSPISGGTATTAGGFATSNVFNLTMPSPATLTGQAGIGGRYDDTRDDYYDVGADDVTLANGGLGLVQFYMPWYLMVERAGVLYTIDGTATSATTTEMSGIELPDIVQDIEDFDQGEAILADIQASAANPHSVTFPSAGSGEARLWLLTPERSLGSTDSVTLRIVMSGMDNPFPLIIEPPYTSAAKFPVASQGAGVNPGLSDSITDTYNLWNLGTVTASFQFRLDVTEA